MEFNFIQLSKIEEIVANGGSSGEFWGAFLGTVSIAWSPIVGIICPPAGVGMALAGAGAIGKGTGLY